MSDCEFDCNLVCIHCGYKARRPGTRRNCTVDRPPSLAVQLSSYGAAVSRWLAAGRPVRTDEQVSGLLKICQDNQCGKYRNGQCLACGCQVNSSNWALINKLRMATEICPKGLWAAEQLSNNPGRLRVGILTPNLYVGGVESWILSLAKEWAKSGSVELVGIGHIGTEGTHQQTLTRQITKAATVVTACAIDGAQQVRSPLDAAGAIAAASDVLIVWSVSADILARVKRPGLRVVGVSHGCHDWWMGAAAELIDHWAAVHPVAVTPIPTDHERVEILPNGIDLERCQSRLTLREARRRLGIPLDGKVVGYAGRLSPEKRIREIAGSAAYLPDGWSVLIVGDGREESAAIGERVYWRPATDQIGDVWRACDVAVVASEAEGYCLAAVEALAAGIPLASTRVGVVEQITDDVEVIPQPANPADTAAACVRAADRGISPKLAAWAQEQSAERMAARWADWLGKIATPTANV